MGLLLKVFLLGDPNKWKWKRPGHQAELSSWPMMHWCWSGGCCEVSDFAYKDAHITWLLTWQSSKHPADQLCKLLYNPPLPQTLLYPVSRCHTLLSCDFGAERKCSHRFKWPLLTFLTEFKWIIGRCVMLQLQWYNSATDLHLQLWHSVL